MSFKQLVSLVACLALAIPSNAILAGFPYNMESFNTNAASGSDFGTGNCWTAASNTDGATVTLQQCVLGSANQAWTFSAGSPFSEGTNGQGGIGTVKIFGNKCLDVTNGVDASGTKLQIFGCSTGNKNQMWQLTTGSNGIQTVQWANSTRCADLTGGSQSAGTPIQIWSCVGNTNQQWVGIFTGTTPPSLPQTALRFHSGIQNDVARQLSFLATDDQDNLPVLMEFTDTAGFGVDWVFEGGSLKSFDGAQCLDVTSGVDADGTLLQVFSCTQGNTNQQWTFNSNFSIQWTGHNKCIDLTNGNNNPGTQLQIFSCFQGNTNQQWRIEPVFSESA